MNIGCIATHQGYFSIYRPRSLKYLLQDIPAIPEYSSYHVVRGWKIDLQVEMDHWLMVEKYQIASINSDTIVDLEMPYSIDQHRYQARYIIFKGQLLGVRLNTLPTHPIFSKWARHKTITHQYPKSNNIFIQSKRRNDFMVGDWNIKTLNLRIGIVFPEELNTMEVQYIDSGVDVMVGSINITRYTTIASKSFVINVDDDGHHCDDSQCQHSVVYIDCNKFMRSKFRKPPVFNDSQPLWQLSIPLAINQPLRHTDHVSVVRQPTEQLIGTHLQPPLPPQLEPIKYQQGNIFNQHHMKIFEDRLRVLEHMATSSSLVILPLLNSADVICFLVVYQLIGARLRVECIDCGCDRVNELAMQMLGVDRIVHQIDCESGGMSQLASVHHALSFANIITNILSNHYNIYDNKTIPVITMHPTYTQILYALAKVFQESGMFNIVGICLFRHHEIEQMLNSDYVKGILQNDGKMSIHASQCGVNKGLYEMIRQLDSKSNEQKKAILSKQFWVWCGYVDLSVESMVGQFARIGQYWSGQYYRLYMMLSNNITPNQQYQTILGKIQSIRSSEANKLQCHKCGFKYQEGYMARCCVRVCNECFCIKCLIDSYNWNLPTNKQSGIISLTDCPVCSQKCSVQSCQKCFRLLSSRTKKEAKKCHYCCKQPLMSIQCQGCAQLFCFNCCKQIFDDQTLQTRQNWKCYVCQKRCKCATCMKNNKIPLKKNHDIFEIQNGLTTQEKQILNSLRYPEIYSYPNQAEDETTQQSLKPTKHKPNPKNNNTSKPNYQNNYKNIQSKTNNAYNKYLKNYQKPNQINYYQKNTQKPNMKPQWKFIENKLTQKNNQGQLYQLNQFANTYRVNKKRDLSKNNNNQQFNMAVDYQEHIEY